MKSIAQIESCAHLRSPNSSHATCGLCLTSGKEDRQDAAQKGEFSHHGLALALEALRSFNQPSGSLRVSDLDLRTKNDCRDNVAFKWADSGGSVGKLPPFSVRMQVRASRLKNTGATKFTTLITIWCAVSVEKRNRFVLVLSAHSITPAFSADSWRH
jgi:hypothetical protein